VADASHLIEKWSPTLCELQLGLVSEQGRTSRPVELVQYLNSLFICQCRNYVDLPDGENILLINQLVLHAGQSVHSFEFVCCGGKHGCTLFLFFDVVSPRSRPPFNKFIAANIRRAAWVLAANLSIVDVLTKDVDWTGVPGQTTGPSFHGSFPFCIHSKLQFFKVPHLFCPKTHERCNYYKSRSFIWLFPSFKFEYFNMFRDPLNSISMKFPN
jgi:hypothetical protein